MHFVDQSTGKHRCNKPIASTKKRRYEGSFREGPLLWAWGCQEQRFYFTRNIGYIPQKIIYVYSYLKKSFKIKVSKKHFI